MKKNKAFLRWMRERKGGTARLFSTENEFSYEDYLDNCEANGITSPGDEDSLGFHEWCLDTARMYYEDDLTRCRESGNLKRRFVVTGTLGLWWGHPVVGPEMCEDFDGMLSQVVTKDIIDVEAVYDTRRIRIVCKHHDGENVFDVYPVKEDADIDLLRHRIDSDMFNPSGWDVRFLEGITDYLA